MINILEIYKGAEITQYLFVAMGILGTMLCIKKIIRG